MNDIYKKPVDDAPLWPVFKTHDDVICYDCKKPVDSSLCGSGSGRFAPGSGKYNRICTHCGTITWYDILEEVTCQLDSEVRPDSSKDTSQ